MTTAKSLSKAGVVSGLISKVRDILVHPINVMHVVESVQEREIKNESL